MGKMSEYFDKAKKIGEDLTSKIKKSGVLDKAKEGLQEGVSFVKSHVSSGLPGPVNEKLKAVNTHVQEIVKKKQAGENASDGISQAKKIFDELIAVCESVKKIEPPKPAEPPKPPEPPKATPPPPPKPPEPPKKPPPPPPPPVDEGQ